MDLCCACLRLIPLQLSKKGIGALLYAEPILCIDKSNWCKTDNGHDSPLGSPCSLEVSAFQQGVPGSTW